MAAIMPASGGLCPRASGRRRAAELQLAPSSHMKLARLDTTNIATMGIDVIEEPVPALAEYGGIPIAFEVSEVFDVVAGADGASRLEARRVPLPYVKDYDAIGDNPM